MTTENNIEDKLEDENDTKYNYNIDKYLKLFINGKYFEFCNKLFNLITKFKEFYHPDCKCDECFTTERINQMIEFISYVKYKDYEPGRLISITFAMENYLDDILRSGYPNENKRFMISKLKECINELYRSLELK